MRIPTLSPTASLPQMVTFAEGGPCERGETAAKTGCTPASGEGGKDAKEEEGGSSLDRGVHSYEDSEVWGDQYEQSKREVSREFMDSLSEEEKYSTGNYTKGGYKKLNSAMRRGMDLDETQTIMAERLNSVIDKHGKFDSPQVLYRGVKIQDRFGDDLPGIMGKWEGRVGETIQMKGFQSTSDLTAPALDASSRRSGDGLIFVIESERGAPISKMSGYDDESEVLLGHDWEYEVAGVDRDQKFSADIWGEGTPMTRQVVRLRVK